MFSHKNDKNNTVWYLSFLLNKIVNKRVSLSSIFYNVLSWNIEKCLQWYVPCTLSCTPQSEINLVSTPVVCLHLCLHLTGTYARDQHLVPLLLNPIGLQLQLD